MTVVDCNWSRILCRIIILNVIIKLVLQKKNELHMNFYSLLLFFLNLNSINLPSLSNNNYKYDEKFKIRT